MKAATAIPHLAGLAGAIELGAAIGLSGAYQASALRLNGAGRLTTLEGDPTLARIARETHQRLGLDNVDVVEGRFDDTLGPVLKAIGPLEYAFVDPRVSCAIHLGTLGVCVLGGPRVDSSPLRLPLQAFARRHHRTRRPWPPAEVGPTA